jgi:hypothetical protein
MTSFSTISNRLNRGPVDSNLILRAYSASALSATGSSTGVELNVKAVLAYKVCFAIAAYTGYSVGSALWAITVEISDAVGGTYTQIGKTVSPVGTALETEIILSGVEGAAVANANFIRVTATKTGSPGNLTYGAWVVPVIC